MEHEAALAAFALCVVLISVGIGPLPLLVRHGLRRWGGGPAAMRRWWRAVTVGLGCGLLAGTAIAGLLFGGWGALWAASVALTLLLAGLDLAWRWLPHIWTVSLLGLGLAFAVATDTVPQALTGAVAGAGLMLTLQISFRLLRGTEAVGTGDIWLIGAIGTFTGAPDVIFVLGLAAVSGLIVESLTSLTPRYSNRQRLGVAYGAHISAAFLLFLIF